MNVTMLASDLASRAKAGQNETVLNLAEVFQKLIQQELKRTCKGRSASIFVGWPEGLVGKCAADVDHSSRDENWSVLCYENGETKYGYIVFEFLTASTICQMWMMGSSSREIDKQVIRNESYD